MRTLLFLLTLVISCNSLADMRVPARCEESVSLINKTDLIFFNSTEVIKVGECIGVELVKRGVEQELPKACGEVIENKTNVLGALSLSKKEALQIGQCMGVINYVYDRYNNEKYRPSRYDSYYSKYKNYVYQCATDMTAVNRLTSTTYSLSSRSQIRDVLCEAELETY
ncbi:MAG: hypothetical protein HRT97_14585 [Moritella sp.]|uniref:hypothetical protein n=1 Tax=Moritella sp. TaxID=78556 RepID=UPI0025DEF65B|nr:hypothetical protein [Moritella sp.]NQZ93553.1 hypothetical protein [Moritella sp.]